MQMKNIIINRETKYVFCLIFPLFIYLFIVSLIAFNFQFVIGIYNFLLLMM